MFAPRKLDRALPPDFVLDIALSNAHLTKEESPSSLHEPRDFDQKEYLSQYSYLRRVAQFSRCIIVHACARGNKL